MGNKEREGGSEKEISFFKKLCDLLDLREKVDKSDTNYIINELLQYHFL